MDKHTPATVLTSVSIYAALIGSTFDPNCRAVFIKAFGESPLGMRTHVFVPTLLTILFIPFPLLAWHLTKLVAHAMQHGRRFSLIILFTYGFEVGKQHPEMRRSQLFCYAIGSYFIGLMAAWIVYASLKGI